VLGQIGGATANSRCRTSRSPPDRRHARLDERLARALLGGARTGVGRHVDISMTARGLAHAVIARAEGEAFRAATGASPAAGASLLNGRLGLLRVYRTARRPASRGRRARTQVLAGVCRALDQPTWKRSPLVERRTAGTAAARETRRAVADLLATRRWPTGRADRSARLCLFLGYILDQALNQIISGWRAQNRIVQIDLEDDRPSLATASVDFRGIPPGKDRRTHFPFLRSQLLHFHFSG